MADYLKYGDIIRLTNGYGGGWKGGILGIGTNSQITGAADTVGTFKTAPNDPTVVQWKILSFLNPGTTGGTIASGDQVLIQAVKDSTFLALFDTKPASGSNYGAATNAVVGGRGSVSWHLLISNNPGNDPNLIVEDNIFLLNDFRGGLGFLDTRGIGSTSGFQYDVSASPLFNRDQNSG
jgi:hypothetical protein